MIRIRLIVYQYKNAEVGEVDMARQQPDGLRMWGAGGSRMFITTLVRGDFWRSLRQAWWLLRQKGVD